MAKSIYPSHRIVRASRGRFVNGVYSPARRTLSTQTTSRPRQRTSVVPPRSSAYPINVVKVRPRHIYINEVPAIDVTRVPTIPEAVEFEDTRQLAVVNKPQATVVKNTLDDPMIWVDPPAFEKILPQKLPREKISSPTRQPQANVSAIMRMPPRDIEEIETFPPLISHIVRKKYSRFSRCVENLRWWLLHPGRLELLLWVSVTIVLIICTSLLMIFLAARLGYITFGSQLP